MKYNTKKYKISKLYNSVLTNKNELKKRKNILHNKYINTYSHTTPRTLYDSDWIVPNVETATTPREYLIQNEEPENEAYIWLHLPEGKTAMKGQTVAMPLYLWFSKELEIPESLLSSVQYTLLLQKSSDFEIFPHTANSYNVPRTDDHYKLKSDGTLIYQGYDVYNNPFSLEEYSTENYPQFDHLSKHYKGQFGSLTFDDTVTGAGGICDITDLGKQWIRKPGYANIRFYQRIVNYTSYTSGSFKSINSTTMRVRGNSHKHTVEWYDTGLTHAGNIVYDVTLTYHGRDIRTFNVQNTNLETIAVTDPVSRIEDLYLHSYFGTSTSSMASPDMSWRSLEHVGYYLHYTNQIDSEVSPGLGGSGLKGVPYGTTAILIKNDEEPTADIPEDLAQATLEKGFSVVGRHKDIIFTRVYQDNADSGKPTIVKGKHRIWIYDKCYISASATQNVEASYRYEYDKYEGIHHVSNIEEFRKMPYYAPEVDVKVRLIVTIDPNLYYQEIQKFNKKKDIHGI